MYTDRKNLASVGDGVRIYETAKIVHPEMVRIGAGSQIDDFVFINGGAGIVFGRFNHIASFVSIIGGGELETGDFVGIAAGARLITGSHHYGDGRRLSPLIAPEEQYVIRGKIILEDDVFIGTNAIVHPKVTIGEGAIIGSAALVLSDVEPWSINIGQPARKVGERPRIRCKTS